MTLGLGFSFFKNNMRPIAEPDPSELPHRYWRMVLASNSSNVPVMSRLDFRETEGGANVANTGSLISGGPNAWVGPHDIFDGNDATFGYTPTAVSRRANPYYIGRDYGATEANWKTVREIVIRNRQDSTPEQGVTSMAMQYSDDGVAWATSWQESFDDWTTLSTVRTSSKSANPLNRTVLNIASPPTDAGPYGTVFTANGNATTSGGRFVFDGNGDYYLKTAANPNISRMAWQATVEVDNLITAGGAYKGIIALGNHADTRTLLCANETDLVILDGNVPRVTAAGFFTLGVAKSFKVQFDGDAIRIYHADGTLAAAGDHLTGMLFNQTSVYLGTEPSDLAGRSLNGGFSGLRIKHGLT